MGEANGPVDEEDGETGQRQEPREDDTTIFCQVDEGEETKEQLENNYADRSALLVNIGEELGAHAWMV
jgi:hypothetical protein